MRVLPANALHPRPQLACLFLGFGLFALAAGCLGLLIGAADLDRLEPWERMFYRWIWPAYFTGYGVLTLCYWWRYGVTKDFSYLSWLRGDQLIHAGLGAVVVAMILHRAGWPTFLYIALYFKCRDSWRSDENRAFFHPHRASSSDAAKLPAQ